MFIDRDGKGNITGQYAAEQQPGQEEIADDDSALLLIAGKAAKLAAIDAAATAATAAGFTWNAAAYRIDTLTQQQISALGSIAMGVVYERARPRVAAGLRVGHARRYPYAIRRCRFPRLRPSRGPSRYGAGAKRARTQRRGNGSDDGSSLGCSRSIKRLVIRIQAKRINK
jgi:hypothetical protein